MRGYTVIKVLNRLQNHSGDEFDDKSDKDYDFESESSGVKKLPSAKGLIYAGNHIKLFKIVEASKGLGLIHILKAPDFFVAIARQPTHAGGSSTGDNTPNFTYFSSFFLSGSFNEVGILLVGIITVLHFPQFLNAQSRAVIQYLFQKCVRKPI